MKYVVIEKSNGDVWTQEFATAEAAIEVAKLDWKSLSTFDQEHSEGFYVLESVNPDDEAENHLDGNIVWSANATLTTMISKWVDGQGITYTSEFDEERVFSDFSFEDADDSWTDELIADLDDPSCERFKAWYVLSLDGEVLDESGYFWIESEEYNA